MITHVRHKSRIVDGLDAKCGFPHVVPFKESVDFGQKFFACCHACTIFGNGQPINGAKRVLGVIHNHCGFIQNYR